MRRPTYAVCLCLLIPSWWLATPILAQPPSLYPQNSNTANTDKSTLPPSIEQDLNRMDYYATSIRDFPATGAPYQEFTKRLKEAPLKVQDIYRNYLDEATPITQKLIQVLDRFETKPEGLSLQELGGFVQWLDAENQRFKGQFTHGETQFSSYQLIEQAVTDLHGVWQYWRLSENFKDNFRPTSLATLQDSQVIQVRLQSAKQAILQLKTLTELRTALTDSVNTFESEK